MECWVLYEKEDLERNRFFAQRLRDAGESLGMETRIVITDDAVGCPDVVVSRCRDWRLSSELELNGALVVNSSEVCSFCNDKLMTYMLADRLGIPHLPVTLPSGKLPDGPPWVVKSRSGHGGSQVMLAHGRDELEKACEDIPDPIVQECAENPGRDMRAYVLDGEIIACVMRSSDTDFRANFSLGGRAELCEPPNECLETVEKIVKALDPVFVGVDFVFGGDGPLLNEVEDVVGTRMLYSLTDLDPARLLMESVHSKRSL